MSELFELTGLEKATLRKGLTLFLMKELSPGCTTEEHSTMHDILEKIGGLTDHHWNA